MRIRVEALAINDPARPGGSQRVGSGTPARCGRIWGCMVQRAELRVDANGIPAGYAGLESPAVLRPDITCPPMVLPWKVV